LLLSAGRFEARGTLTRGLLTLRTSERFVFAEGELRPGFLDFFIQKS
jgi:hypothetical protein